jgi:pimeloyl-ACP methyl ester carboxylesterase
MSSSENNPIVLVHGWAGSFRDTWQKPGIDALLEDIGRTVLPFNLLGHADQEKPTEPEAYAELPQWFLDHLPSETPAIDAVGFSLGALTILRALVDQPSRFGKVILAGIGDGVFSRSTPDANRRIIDALEGKLADDDELGRMFAHYGNQPGNDLNALTAIMKRPPSEPIDPQVLAGISNEVLVIIGDKDFTFPATKLADAFPNGRLVVLKNTDHFSTPDSFSFIDQILDFFA